MIDRIFPAMFLSVLCGLATPARAERLIEEFSGSRAMNTAEFDVLAPWIVDWHVSGELSRVVAVDVSLFNASSGAYEGKIVQTKIAGDGVRLFSEGGRYYFRVDATLMNWRLKVIELTKEEAGLYTPKSRSLLDR